MKILIALDASSHSQRALELVTRLRWPAGSRVIVVGVVRPLASAVAEAYAPVTIPPELLEQQRGQLEAVVARAANALRETGFATEERVEVGDPRHALVEIARGERADLMVVGSHGLTGVMKLMLGSVSSHVVTHAPCSVLVVKQAGAR